MLVIEQFIHMSFNHLFWSWQPLTPVAILTCQPYFLCASLVFLALPFIPVSFTAVLFYSRILCSNMSSCCNCWHEAQQGLQDDYKQPEIYHLFIRCLKSLCYRFERQFRRQNVTSKAMPITFLYMDIKRCQNDYHPIHALPVSQDSDKQHCPSTCVGGMGLSKMTIVRLFGNWKKISW